MRLILFLIVLFSGTLWAAPARSNTPQWQCQLSASLRGNPQHFMFYGRDSWNGDGILRCQTKGGISEKRTLAVSFNSSLDGFGADDRSVIDIRIYIATLVHPADLQIRAVVSDIGQTGNIQWTLATELSEARIYVLNQSPDYASRSLQRGTIYIRSTGE